MTDPKKKFAHLHVHTTYSLLDGISQRSDLIKKTKEFGLKGMAVTEHGNMFNSISFYKDCLDAGIVPIIGMESYIAPDSRTGRSYAKKGEAEEDAKNGDLSMSAYHLTILSKNREGYDNLMQLSTLSHREGFYRKPRIDDEILERHKSGLIVLSGCLASKTSRLIVAGQKEKALAEIDRQRKIFGDDFYLEVMAHNIDEEKVVRDALIEFGNKHGIGLVMTGDSHYTEHNHSIAHEAALCIGINKTFDDPTRWKFNGDGYWYKSAEEMYEVAEKAGIPESALLNTSDIMDRVQDYGFKLTSKTKKSTIPLFRAEGGAAFTGEECDMMLDMKAHQGLIERGLIDKPGYLERLKVELDMIKKKEFSSYFLIIADIIDYMRKQNILAPIGRGSSVGSLTCYSLFITGLDPVKHNVPFSRFINEGRKDLPDIDTDISQARRKEIIDYIVKKYGADKVAQIVTFQTLAAKGAVDNVGRTLGVPVAVRRQVGKLIGDVTKDDSLEDILEGNEAARKIMEKIPQWIDIAKVLEGNNKNLGAHAAGIVISNDSITNHVPLVRDSKEGYLVTQYDMKDLGELGLLKLDMLGLKTMDIIQYTIEAIEKSRGVKIDFQNIPTDDAATFKTIASGKFVSVFQYDSGGLRNAAKQLQPDTFEHLVALNALYRPGPMLKEKGGQSIMDKYIERRHGRQAIETWHPDLDPVFASTMGLCIFQEQVMNMAKVIAGFDDLEADEYRAAVGKKDKVKFDAAQAKFISRGIAFGRESKLMHDLAKKLEGFARYGWNIGHSLAYSYISYVTAWLETHYAHEYYCAILNVNVDDADQFGVLLSNIIKSGTKIVPPDINVSGESFITDGKCIYMSLYSVAKLGEASMKVIMKDREINGKYKDYLDFCVRMSPYGAVNKSVKENLIKAWAFNWDKSMLDATKFMNTENIQKTIKKFDDKIPLDQIRPLIEPKIIHSPVDFSEQDRLKFEREVLKFYITSHPIIPYQRMLRMFNNYNMITPSDLQEQQAGTRVLMLGVVETKEMRKTKLDMPYMSLTVSDNVESQYINIWSPMATQLDAKISAGQLVLLGGMVAADKLRPDQLQLKVDKACPIIPGINGIPIKEYLSKDEPTGNQVALALGARVAAASRALTRAGHAFILADHAYITPDNYDQIKTFTGRVYFTIDM